MMKAYYSEIPRIYDGTQLRSHFAFETFQICGDSIVSFQGPANVNLNHMVDKEDVLANEPIYSENMLHFIVEHFTDNFEWTIACQRLLISCLREDLQDVLDNYPLERRGDDIFDENAKLTVSIATRSPVSCLIHTGINISSKNTPLLTKGLEDYKLLAPALATSVMNRYIHEIKSMKLARAKVRGVM